MTVTAIAITTAIAGSVLLVTAGVEHVRHFGRLRAALIAQALIPYSWHRAAAATLVTAELVVGSAVLVLAPVMTYDMVPLLVAQATLYAGLLAYAGTLRIARPSAPCGCFGYGTPATTAVLVRAAMLCAGTAAAALAVFELGWTTVPWQLITIGAVVTAIFARIAPTVLVNAART